MAVPGGALSSWGPYQRPRQHQQLLCVLPEVVRDQAPKPAAFLPAAAGCEIVLASGHRLAEAVLLGEVHLLHAAALPGE